MSEVSLMAPEPICVYQHTEPFKPETTTVVEVVERYEDSDDGESTVCNSEGCNCREVSVNKRNHSFEDFAESSFTKSYRKTTLESNYSASVRFAKMIELLANVSVEAFSLKDFYQHISTEHESYEKVIRHLKSCYHRERHGHRCARSDRDKARAELIFIQSEMVALKETHHKEVVHLKETIKELKETHEKEIVKIKEHSEKTVERYEKTIRELKEKHEKEIIKIREHSEKTVKEVKEKYEKEITRINTHHEKIIKETREKYEKEIKTLIEKHEKELVKIKESHRSEIIVIKDSHTEIIRELKEKYEKEIQVIRETHRCEIEKIRESSRLEVIVIKEKHESVIEKLKETHEKFVHELRQTHEKTIREIKETHTKEIQRIVIETRTEIDNSHGCEIEEWQVKYKEAVELWEESERAFKASKKHYREEIEELNELHENQVSGLREKLKKFTSESHHAGSGGVRKISGTTTSTSTTKSSSSSSTSSCSSASSSTSVSVTEVQSQLTQVQNSLTKTTKEKETLVIKVSQLEKDLAVAKDIISKLPPAPKKPTRGIGKGFAIQWILYHNKLVAEDIKVNTTSWKKIPLAFDKPFTVNDYVWDAVAKHAAPGAAGYLVHNATVGMQDPAHNKTKTLIVAYTLGDSSELRYAAATENDFLKISAN